MDGIVMRPAIRPLGPFGNPAGDRADEVERVRGEPCSSANAMSSATMRRLEAQVVASAADDPEHEACTGDALRARLAAPPAMRYVYRVIERRSSVTTASLLLAAAALVLLLAGGSSSTHLHADGTPAVYNPDCQVLALATLTGTVLLTASVLPLVLALAVGAAPQLPAFATAERPYAARSPRAPPALSV
jgi:hypothetical protein